MWQTPHLESLNIRYCESTTFKTFPSCELYLMDVLTRRLSFFLLFLLSVWTACKAEVNWDIQLNCITLNLLEVLLPLMLPLVVMGFYIQQMDACGQVLIHNNNNTIFSVNFIFFMTTNRYQNRKLKHFNCLMDNPENNLEV